MNTRQTHPRRGGSLRPSSLCRTFVDGSGRYLSNKQHRSIKRSEIGLNLDSGKKFSGHFVFPDSPFPKRFFLSGGCILQETLLGRTWSYQSRLPGQSCLYLPCYIQGLPRRSIGIIWICCRYISGQSLWHFRGLFRVTGCVGCFFL